MKAENQKTVSIKLDSDIKAKLVKLGKIKDRSPHWLMNRAINNYIEQEEEKENLRQQTLSRWEEVQKGHIVEHDKVMKWLDSWGTEQEEDIKL